MEDAQKLRGKIIEIYREDAPDDLVFAAELIGMDVFCKEDNIGQITDVLDYPGNKVYVVKGQHSYMIPAVKAFILSTNIEENKMEVMLIEGMQTDEN
jgi:16S rRNA processing protein RimM